ncbi:MAG TPA: ABC transporter permease, partial [Chloroflexota bacterium]|nr:ABC transporter permease [Chloroflexota bacterium]
FRVGFRQFLAIGLVAGMGVALFYGFLASYLDQKASYAVSYDRLAFADVTVAMRQAPRSVVQELARLPGVEAVEGRIVKDIEVEQESGRRPRVIGRLITVPADGPPAVNRYMMLEGRPLSRSLRREVLLEASFASANRYRVGDRLYPEFNGRRVTFVVVGIVASPEYIFPIASKQFSIPMPETFGVMFVSQELAESLLGMAGSVNEVAVITDAGQADAVGALIERRLHVYGPEKPTTRADQPSNKLLQANLEGRKPILVVMPALFLAAAGLAVALVLARWVQSQRGQIGFLRAVGFTARTVLWHYLEMGLVVGCCGGVIGDLLGHALAVWIGAVYRQVLHMPYSRQEFHPDVAALAFLLSVVTCALGALGPARQAARITPARAMRGQMPTTRWSLKAIRLPPTVAMPVRNLLRRPLRTLGTASGVASAVILMVLAGTFLDSIDSAMDLYVNGIQRYDLSVAFVPERSQAVLFDISRWPGVLRVEPTLEIAVRVGHSGFDKETIAIGLLPNG